jgi:hypothetical protein
VPVILETFTFLDRNTVRDVALAWRDSLSQVADLRILTVTPADLEEAWPYFQRRELHKLSAVDATSFVLMSHEKSGPPSRSTTTLPWPAFAWWADRTRPVRPSRLPVRDSGDDHRRTARAGSEAA